MPTVVTGQLATKGTNAINSAQLIVDMSRDIYEYDPNASPILTVLTNRLRSRPATQPEVKWLEDEPLPSWDTTTATSAQADTTIDVTNGTYWRAGDLVLVPRTGETMRVVSVASNVLTVTRAWTGSDTAINSGENLLRIGAAEMEGDTSPAAKSTVTANKNNYCQIVKTPVHLSKTLEATDLYGGNERTRQRRKAGAEHARRWEEILLHGRKKEDTSTGTNPIRSAGGVDEYITTNVLAAGGTLTESEFLDFLGDSMRYSTNQGSRNKVLVASREVMQTISSWAGAKLQMRPTDKTYGINVTMYQSAMGVVDIINHPLLEQGYAGTAYILDLAAIRIRPLRPTALHTNIQSPAEDGYKDEYITEQTFELGLEKAHAKITGVTF
jgi:hypothetical protein